MRYVLTIVFLAVAAILIVMSVNRQEVWLGYLGLIAATLAGMVAGNGKWGNHKGQ